jgi:hypothetical protein
VFVVPGYTFAESDNHFTQFDRVRKCTNLTPA